MGDMASNGVTTVTLYTTNNSIPRNHEEVPIAVFAQGLCTFTFFQSILTPTFHLYVHWQLYNKKIVFVFYAKLPCNVGQLLSFVILFLLLILLQTKKWDGVHCSIVYTLLMMFLFP